jgi:hypothetical protein
VSKYRWGTHADMCPHWLDGPCNCHVAVIEGLRCALDGAADALYAAQTQLRHSAVQFGTSPHHADYALNVADVSRKAARLDE